MAGENGPCAEIFFQFISCVSRGISLGEDNTIPSVYTLYESADC